MDKNNITEKRIREIIKEESTKSYRSGAPMVDPHNHDGNNNLQIQEKFSIHNSKFGSFLLALNTDPVAGEATVSYSSGIYNPSTIYFYGIARTPIGGSATTKCSITATAHLGTCFISSSTITKTAPRNVIYASASSTFTFTGGIWVPRVFTDSSHFVTAHDDAGTIMGYIDVQSWTLTTIVFRVFINPDWSIQGNIIIT